MVSSQPGVAVLDDPPKMGSCQNGNEPSWRGNKNWLPGARQTEALHPRHKANRRQERQRLHLEVQCPRNLWRGNRPVQSQRNGSIRKGRRTALRWTSLYHQQRVGSFPRNNSRKNTSNLRLSRSASLLVHLLPIIHQSLRIRLKTWLNRRITMQFSSLMLSPKPPRQ